jgi:hypothetical protein
MKIRNAAGILLTAAASLWLTSCTSTYREVYPTLMDGKYDSEFPYRNCSEQLQKISGVIERINCVAYYQSYVFPAEAKVTCERLKEPSIMDQAVRVVYLNRTASGTALRIGYQNKHLCLLTCAHVVDFSDTILAFYTDENHERTPYIRTLSIKDHQSNYISGIPFTTQTEILACDAKKDVALLGTKFVSEAPPAMPVFDYPLGSAKELEWGAFVYLFGYPSGQCIVTKAIVSQPNKDRSGSFLTDAVFNRGFSGGAVLAVRDGVPHFELVGMAQQVPGHTEYHVTPSADDAQVDYDPEISYKGDLYVERRAEIDYGVAQIISVESIVEFLLENKNKADEKGYDVGSFIARGVRGDVSKQGTGKETR